MRYNQRLKTGAGSAGLSTGYLLSYLAVAVFLTYQLTLTLYQVGKGISYQAKLAQLNHRYQTLAQEKTDLAFSAGQALNLTQAKAKAQMAGFVKLTGVALTKTQTTVALLP